MSTKDQINKKTIYVIDVELGAFIQAAVSLATLTLINVSLEASLAVHEWLTTT